MPKCDFNKVSPNRKYTRTTFMGIDVVFPSLPLNICL